MPDIPGVEIAQTADAAPVRFNITPAPDGWVRSSDKLGATPPPETLSWDESCLTTALSIIANQYTGTATSIDVRACLSGTAAAAATITESGGTDWSISTDNLVHAGSNTGSGSLALTATATTNVATSEAKNWRYTAPPGGSDTTAPTKITGLSIALNGSNQPVITFDSPVDPIVSGQPQSGLSTYTVSRNGVALTPVSFSAGGLAPTFTSADVGTLSPVGASTQSGADWLLEAEGEISSTADAFRFTYASVPGDFSCTAKVESFTSAPSNFSKSGCMARVDQPADQTTAPYVMCAPRANGSVKMYSRSLAGGATTEEGAASAGYLAFPGYTQLVKAGDSYTCNVSADGNNWIAQVTKTLTLGTTLNVGLAGASVVDGDTVQIQYRDLALTNRARISYTDTGATAGTTPSYTITAKDVSNNVSTASAAATVEIPAAAITAKKWHPGHYLKTTGESVGSAYISSVNSTISSRLTGYSNFRGAWVAFSWGRLNPTGSTYDWSQVYSVLNALAATGGEGRLIVNLGYKSFGTTNTAPMMPADILSGNIYSTTTGQLANMVAMWRPEVMTRYIQFLAAFAAEFDGNPKIEMIDSSESAPSVPDGTGGDLTKAALATQLKRMYDAYALYFPNTMAMANLNSLSNQIGGTSGLMEYAYDLALGRSGPDAFDDNASLIFRGLAGGGSGTGVRDYRGLMAHGLIASYPVLGVGAKDYNGPASNIINWSQTNKVTHLSWISWLTTTNETWAAINTAITADPLLWTTCPTNLVGCDTSN